MRDELPVCRRCFDQQSATECDDDTCRGGHPRREEEEEEEEKSKTSDLYSPHQGVMSDWLPGRRCSLSRNPGDDLTYLLAPTLTTSSGDDDDVAKKKKMLKSSLKWRRKDEREGCRLSSKHQQQQLEKDGKEERRSVRFHLAPLTPPRLPSSSKTPLSQPEREPDALLKIPALHKWLPEAIEGEGTSWSQVINTNIRRPCEHRCGGGGHALNDPWQQGQGRLCQGETYQGHEMCSLHGMTRFRGCPQHSCYSVSGLSAYPPQGHSSQTERSFKCHSLPGRAPHSHMTSASSCQGHNCHLPNDYRGQGQPCQGRLLEGRRWCHRRLGRWSRSHDNGIEEKQKSFSSSSSSLPAWRSSIYLKQQTTGSVRRESNHVTPAWSRCAPTLPPLALSTSGCSGRHLHVGLAEASVVVACAGHAESEVRHWVDANMRGQSSRTRLYGDIPQTEEDFSMCAPSDSRSLPVCSPSTAAFSTASIHFIDDPDYDKECPQRSLASSTGATPPAKNEKKMTKTEKKAKKKKEREKKEDVEEEDVENASSRTWRSLPQLNRIEKPRENKNREKRKRCIVS